MSCVQDIVYDKQLLSELGYKNVKVILEQDNNGGRDMHTTMDNC
jgi:hypothetical protein